MFRRFFTKRFTKRRSSADDGSATGRKNTTTEESADLPVFGKISDDPLNVLLRHSDPTGVATALNAIDKEIGKGKGHITASEIIYTEVTTQTLTLPGCRVEALIHVPTHSRSYIFEAHHHVKTAHEESQAIIYLVSIPSKAEEYLSLRQARRLYPRDIYQLYTCAWERDRFELGQMFELVHPNKPLLLLVMKGEGENDDDFDLERIVTLLGLGRLQRPFRAVLYSEETQNNTEILKEAFNWLTLCVHSKDDESTAMMTRSYFDTAEDDSSVVTSTSMAVSLARGGHYVLDYEPTLQGGNPTLHWFEPIKKGTPCPFARAAKLWGGKLLEDIPGWQGWRNSSAKEVREIAKANAGPLAEFVARSKNGEPLDGFCLLLSHECWSVVVLGQALRVLLTQLADLDPAPGENSMRKMGRIDDPQWRFRFAGEDFFITTFGGTYRESSSRHTFGVWKTFVLFQPLISFGRHGLGGDTPASATNWENPITMRDKARVAFKKSGCPYHIPEKLPYPVAEHIVKPDKDDGTSCIRWWVPSATFLE